MKTATFAVKADGHMLFHVEFDVDVCSGVIKAAWRDGDEMSKSETAVWVSAFGKDRIVERAMSGNHIDPMSLAKARKELEMVLEGA